MVNVSILSRCEGIEHFLIDVARDLKRDIEFVVNFQDWPHMNKYDTLTFLCQ